MNKVLIAKILSVATLFIGVVFASINIFHYAGETTLGADIVSRVLPAEAHRIGLGVPYKNYWEITPPGHYIVLDVWSQFFGFSPLSIKVLHLFVSILIVGVVFYVLSQVVSGLYIYISAVLIYFFLFSTRLTTFIMPAEILALLFAVSGLASLFYFKDYKKALFISGFLFFFSGQVKDPFLFSGFALVPYILFLLLKSKKDFYQGFIYSISGVLSAAGLCIVYLALVGSLKDYLSILSYKSIAFPIFDTSWLTENFLVHVNFAKNVFFYFGYSIFLPLIIFVSIKIYFKIKDGSMNFTIDKKTKQNFIQTTATWRIKNHDLWTTSFFVLGLSIGFVIQRSLGSHYYLVVVLPMIMFISLCFNYTDLEISNYKKIKWLRILIFVCYLAILLPKKAYFVDYNFNKALDIRFIPKLMIWANENRSTPVLDKIDSKTTKDDCILDIYGWGVGTSYLYAERRPCTRFFIANLVVKDWQVLEYKHSVIQGGPKAVIYNPTAGDLDYNAFEGRVINFPKIIKKCYVQDTEFKTLYWPNKKGDKLNDCIRDNAGA